MKKFTIVIGIILVAAIGTGIYFARSGQSQEVPTAFANMPIEAVSTSLRASISVNTPASPGMKRYYNQPHHFTLEYPEGMEASELPGAGSSLVVAFKDPQTGDGFQVFAVPYNDSQITQQRFDLDEPSGVMTDPQNITIDGAAATEFFSQSKAMGDTREVWFLKGGLLYEVTTYKSLDSMLQKILQTWQFVN